MKLLLLRITLKSVAIGAEYRLKRALNIQFKLNCNLLFSISSFFCCLLFSKSSKCYVCCSCSKYVINVGCLINFLYCCLFCWNVAQTKIFGCQKLGVSLVFFYIWYWVLPSLTNSGQDNRHKSNLNIGTFTLHSYIILLI